MSLKYLGEQFDIHGGGQDLIFPHHENEIAQSSCLTNQPMAKYWMHNGFITINKEKMSKSLGNFFLLRDILDKFDPQTVRFYLISVHYRSPLDFDDEKLQVAQKGLERLRNAALGMENGKKYLGECPREASLQLQGQLQSAKEQFVEAMNDDFNTALAIAALFDLAREINTYLKNERLDAETLAQAEAVFGDLLGVLGLDFTQGSDMADGLMDEAMDCLLALRQAARVEKDFVVADFIRDALKEEGIIVEDGPQGMVWKMAGTVSATMDGVMSGIIGVRKAARGNKNFRLADNLRGSLQEMGILLEDGPQGTTWKIFKG